jgi:hypothetical protein
MPDQPRRPRSRRAIDRDERGRIDFESARRIHGNIAAPANLRDLRIMPQQQPANLAIRVFGGMPPDFVEQRS